jgi:transcriptional regulator with XRE-family HTH domain
MLESRNCLADRTSFSCFALPRSARFDRARVAIPRSISFSCDSLSLDCRPREAAFLCSSKREGNLLAKQVGQLIRRLRRAQGMSQEEFAEQCGLHRTYIGTIERGEKTMTIETANKVALTLGLTLSQLFDQVERLPGAQEDEHRETGVDTGRCRQCERAYRAP